MGSHMSNRELNGSPAEPSSDELRERASAPAENGARVVAPHSDAVGRLSGESLEEWAQRFATTAALRDAQVEPRGWSPLRLFGLSVRPGL